MAARLEQNIPFITDCTRRLSSASSALLNSASIPSGTPPGSVRRALTQASDAYWGGGRVERSRGRSPSRSDLLSPAIRPNARWAASHVEQSLEIAVIIIILSRKAGETVRSA